MNRFLSARLSRFAVVLGIALAGLAASMPRAQGPAPADESLPPNIVFVLADDLGYGDLGAYGQTRIRTPHLDRLAAEGMRFTDFYAGSTVCAPSRCVLLTGLHTGHAYVRGNGKLSLRASDRTVAEVLRGAGYATAAFGKWSLGQEGSEGMPTRKGFDSFFGYLDQTHAHNYYPTFLVRDESRVPLRNVVPDEGRHGQGVATVRVDYSHDLIAEEALAAIDRLHGRPFFLYLAVTLPHANNEAKQEGMEVPDLGPYEDESWPKTQKAHAAMVSRLDRDVGRLLAKLEEHRIADRSVVMFSSDNGPHREGGADPEFFDSNGPLRGIKRDLYEGGIRVPFIVRWPGRTRPGSTSAWIGGFQDLLPAICELAGISDPGGHDGESFVPALRGEARAHERELYWEFYERDFAQAIRRGRYKAIRRGERTELYDLEADPGEALDLAAMHADLLRELELAMDRSHTPSEIWKPRRDRRANDAATGAGAESSDRSSSSGHTP